MKPKANELVAGMFVIIMVGAVLLFLSWTGGGFERWFMQKRPAVTWFHNSGGLKEKVQVVYQGYPIGDVVSIEFDGKRRLIQVNMSLRADFALPETGIAMITTASLLGDPYIEITTDYRNIDQTMFVRGDDRIVEQEGVLVLDSIDPAGWGMIQVQASTMLADIKKEFNAMSDTIGHILTSTDQIVSDPEFRTNIHGIAANARIATARLPQTLDDAGAMMASANSAARRIDTMLAGSQDTITRIMRNVDEVSFNARALTYALSEKPSRLIWEDRERQSRIAAGDTSVIFGSWLAPQGAATGASGAFAPDARPDRRNRTSFH